MLYQINPVIRHLIDSGYSQVRIAGALGIHTSYMYTLFKKKNCGNYITASQIDVLTLLFREAGINIGYAGIAQCILGNASALEKAMFSPRLPRPGVNEYFGD